MSTAEERADVHEAGEPVNGEPSPAEPAPGEGATDDREAGGRPRPGLTENGRVRRTRVGAWWGGLIAAALVLTALLIFIGQNSRTVTIHYLGLEGQASLAVALLLAAVAGVLLVAIPGTARIVQLRRALKKNAAASHRRD